jgi:hypothetical protein
LLLPFWPNRNKYPFFVMDDAYHFSPTVKLSDLYNVADLKSTHNNSLNRTPRGSPALILKTRHARGRLGFVVRKPRQQPAAWPTRAALSFGFRR